jgi:hypothetical protein
MNDETVAAALTTLFTELVEGAPGKTAFVLNGGDAGLLRSLDALPAAAASRSTSAGATIAAHVDHLLYGLTLMNRWRAGENPWDDADWTRSWRRTSVTDDEWRTLRAALAREARRWLDGLRQPREMNETDLTGVIASVVHLAYHLGSIRQIDKDARGPKA